MKPSSENERVATNHKCSLARPSSARPSPRATHATLKPAVDHCDHYHLVGVAATEAARRVRIIARTTGEKLTKTGEPDSQSPTARMLPGPPARPARRPAGGQPEVFRANSADRMWTGRGAECRTGSNRSSEACAWPRPRWGRACSGLKRHVMTLHDVVSRPQFVIKFSQVYTERYGEFDTALTHELYCSCRSIIYSGLTIW